MIAGNETARNAITGGMFAFINHPEQWQRLQNDPSLIRTAVEEIIRWVSPVIQIARVATADTELASKRK
jgi:cholest-4-en-3-one 26-monooxygenase